MDKNIPLLSLCIPTNGAIQFIEPVLDSIYSQGCDERLYEVVICDNAKNEKLRYLIDHYGHHNLHYHQSDAHFSQNIIKSAKYAKGIFCKFINHRAILRKGAINKLLDMVKKYKDTKPVIYCTNGVLGESDDIVCQNLNELVYNLHFYCTWMAGIGIWQNDITNLEGIEYNKLFSNTTILFEQRQKESQYVLCNFVYFDQLNGRGKGFYNLFQTFAVEFPNMLVDLQRRNRITEDTFRKVLIDLYGCLRNFYSGFVLLYPDPSFDITGIRKSMNVYYPWYKYYQMVWSCKKEYYMNSFRDWGHAKKLYIKRKLRIL